MEMLQYCQFVLDDSGGLKKHKRLENDQETPTTAIRHIRPNDYSSHKKNRKSEQASYRVHQQTLIKQRTCARLVSSGK